jgi:ADP-ribosylation factor-binding protein GGA
VLQFLEAVLDTEVEGSIEFRTEVGRYRFLNEIIRILSPKYLGLSTSEKVKERAIKFLKDAAGVKRKKWFPSEYSKIETVFKSLVDGGVIAPPAPDDRDANDPDAEFRKNIFERGENAALLRKLLQSKDPNDLQAANRLIKNLVDEEGKRNERRSELHSLIDRIETSTSLLTEMLNQAHIVDFEIIDELVSTCNALRNKMGSVRTETNEETTSLVQASENIEAVIELYEKRKRTVKEELISADTPPQSASAHSKFSGHETSQSLVDELLMGIDLNLVKSGQTSSTSAAMLTSAQDENNLLNLDFEPETVTGPQLARGKSQEDAGKKPFFDELNKMSRELMDQSLGPKMPAANLDPKK